MRRSKPPGSSIDTAHFRVLTRIHMGGAMKPYLFLVSCLFVSNLALAAGPVGEAVLEDADAQSSYLVIKGAVAKELYSGLTSHAKLLNLTEVPALRKTGENITCYELEDTAEDAHQCLIKVQNRAKGTIR